MKEEWRSFWREFLRYKRYPLWGLLLSLVPYTFNFSYWKSRNMVWLGLLLSLNVSLSITLMIFVFVGGVFAILMAIHIRTGLVIKRVNVLQFILVGLGIATGVWLGMYINSLVLHEQLRGSVIFSALLLSGLAGLGFVLHMAYRQAKEDALALQAAVAESKYNALEHQMRPHFLFNTLNSLAELIESGHERAAEMTHLLADLYRQILANSKLKTAPIESEIGIARRYLELEKLRFGARLRFSFTVAEEAKGVFIPSLMLQTLVENAVKHGVSKAIGGGEILVDVRKAADHLFQLRVENTGEAFAPGHTTGTGLANTAARLDLLYDQAHQFTVTANGDHSTVASFFFSGEKID